MYYPPNLHSMLEWCNHNWSGFDNFAPAVKKTKLNEQKDSKVKGETLLEKIYREGTPLTNRTTRRHPTSAATAAAVAVGQPLPSIAGKQREYIFFL